MFREGLKHILSSTRYKVHSEVVMCWPFEDVYIQSEEPLLFVIDSNLVPDGRLDVVRCLKEQNPGSRVVVLADEFNLEDMAVCLRSGIDGYCLATTGCEALVKYLDLVMLGEVVFPAAMFLSAITPAREVSDNQKEIAINLARRPQISHPSEAGSSPVRSLSSREAEILQCLIQGAPNKVIARKLDVAEATVKVHIKAILRKIRVANRTQAAMWAVNHLSAVHSEGIWSQLSDR
jgi:two-component system nitrate/nitrite response regulator NarL